MRTAVVLPAPFGPSRPSTRPCGHLERDALQRFEVAEALHQALGDDRRFVHGIPPYRVFARVPYDVHLRVNRIRHSSTPSSVPSSASSVPSCAPACVRRVDADQREHGMA